MGCAPFRVLRITDGTTSVDLLNETNGFYCTDWKPAVSEPKAGGVWRDSPLSDGRRLAMRQRANAIEKYTLQVRGFGQDALIWNAQELRRLLEKATQYWTANWQNEPVWIEAQSAYETNLRYGLIHDYRTPNDGFPYNCPFESIVNRVAFEDFSLVIERSPCWWADEPGTGTCVQVSGTQDWCFPWYLEFDGADSRISISDNAVIQDLPASTSHFTVEAWIRANGYGESNVGRIFDKIGAGTPGWYLRINSTHGVEFYADFNNTDMLARSGLDDFTADGEWHHIAATCRNPLGSAALPRIWVDGGEVSYTTQQTGVNAYGGDIGDALYIGNNNGLSATFDGDIGWCRISTGELYFNATHTVPPRCTLPAIVGATIGQWIGEGGDGTTIPNQEGTAAIDGTQANCTFDCDCETTIGRTATCNEEVYIANKHNVAQLTHVYVDNGGVFGVNLLQNGVLPYDILPAVPAVNDALYLGIDTTVDDSGPFCSLVFDIGTAIVDVTTIAWEYWNAAWVALTVQDNTDADGAMSGVAFDTTGVNSVHFEHPSDWATTTVNGITGYWVRARVTAIGGAPTAPTQQNRNPYTIVWPYIDIDDAQVGGDVAALAEQMIVNQSSSTAGNGGLLTDVVVGLRSISRGSDFTAFINIADEQNVDGITVTVPDANTTFQNRIQAPCGRVARYAPAGAVAGLATRITITFSQALSRQFYGTYRAYLRSYQTVGAAGSVGVALEIFDIYTTVTAYVDDTALYGITDLGLINISPTSMMDGDDVFNSATINIQMNNSDAGGATIDVIDLILIPVDEWSGQFSWNDGDKMDWNDLLDIDSITHPKSFIRSFMRDSSDMSIYSIWQPITPQIAQLQSNADQRLWFFTRDTNSRAYISVGHTVRVFDNQRYLSMRGDR